MLALEGGAIFYLSEGGKLLILGPGLLGVVAAEGRDWREKRGSFLLASSALKEEWSQGIGESGWDVT